MGFVWFEGGLSLYGLPLTSCLIYGILFRTGLPVAARKHLRTKQAVRVVAKKVSVTRWCLSVMGSLEALSRLETVLRQYFHCLGLGLEG